VRRRCQAIFQLRLRLPPSRCSISKSSDVTAIWPQTRQDADRVREQRSGLRRIDRTFMDLTSLSNGEFPFQIINPGGLCDRPDPDAEGQSHCRDHRNPCA
jgi:hypothetical protein